jgi:hypothetical protein
MIVTPLNDVVLGDWAPDPTRSSGLHLSTIIHAMSAELEPDRFTGTMSAARVETGLAVERMLEEGLKRKWPGRFRPTEFVLDGIAMSPDGYDPHAGTLEEFKCTWMSSRDCPGHRKFWHWLVQIKGYLKALELLEARLRVFFVNGDYSRKPPDGDPGLKSYHLLFTQQEIEDNWAMIFNYARSKGML